MDVLYKHPRGTAASLASLASSNLLEVGQIYFLTDEERIAIATSTSAYVKYAKLSDASGGGGGSPATNVEIDFGTDGVTQKTITVTDGLATTSNKVMASIPYVQPNNVDSDELEMDPLSAHGAVINNGVVTLMVVSVNGSPLVGKRNILYSLS